MLLLFLQKRLGLQNYKEGEAMSIPKDTRRESFHIVRKTLTAQQRVVLQILRENGDMTAQEVADKLCLWGVTPTNERNFAAPRLTELSDMGLVQAVGKKKCCKTGRRVTVWSAVSESKTSPPTDNQMQFEMQTWLDSLEHGGGNRNMKI
jgi:predicted ArsR family transcriptional regulator